uniref:Uncharacterized protein n=1 Tax=Vespula pensylvanica TaxID=30213 RepID=A0A834N6V0_VESPE|nr:hypothetical protein H0235_016666 [Vespula pensylvanica]
MNSLNIAHYVRLTLNGSSKSYGNTNLTLHIDVNIGLRGSDGRVLVRQVKGLGFENPVEERGNVTQINLAKKFLGSSDGRAFTRKSLLLDPNLILICLMVNVTLSRCADETAAVYSCS